MSEGVRKTRVELETVGVQGAARAIGDLDQKLKQTEQQARQTQAAADRAQGSGQPMRMSLIDRMRRRGFLTSGGLHAGPVQLGPSGFAMNRGILRAPGMGVAGGVVIGGQIAGAALNQAADWIDYLQENDLSAAQVFSALMNASHRAAFEWTGARAITRGIHRLAGTKAEVFDAAYEMLLPSGQSQLDADIAALAAGQRQRWEIMRRQDEAEQRTREAIEARVAAMYEHADAEYARAMGNMKFSSNPLVLPEALWRLKRELEAHAQALAALRKRQDQKDQADALLRQDGS